MPEISIIIPVFNVEQYLKQCLDSIVSQDCSSIEVILMDSKGRLQVPYECDSDDVTSCSTPYRRVKR